jgi:hypothetical protein
MVLATSGNSILRARARVNPQRVSISTATSKSAVIFGDAISAAA